MDSAAIIDPKGATVEAFERLNGAICVDRPGPLDAEETRMLEGLALEAAVVIQDARIRRDAAAWQGRLDEILGLDEQVGGDEVLGRLGE